MLEDDLRKLAQRDDRPLSSLTADMWRREAELASAANSARRLMAWQAGVLAVAVVSSASFGLAQAASLHPKHGALFAVSDFAPSSLILRGKP